MDDRKKLIELIEKARKAMNKEEFSCDLARNSFIAEYLIANGVTVQEWISVKDRLPDLISCNVGTAYSEAVIAWTSGRKAMIAVWDGIDWIAPFDYWEAWGEEITHWMPLPLLPKGE